MENKVFSIILPTKNNTRTIKKCLESILNQTYSNIEVIFVDNFSSDDTLEIAKSFEDKMNIKIFQVGPERHVQRRFGFEKSTGDFVYFIDSDMYICSPDFVRESVDVLIDNPNIGGLIVPEDNFEGKGYWTKVKALERSFYDGDDNIEAARIFRRKVYEEVGGYNEELIAGEDWDLSERIKEKYNIDRIKSRVLHDEGEIELMKLLNKKMYYGGEIGGYIKNNSTKSILSKIYFFRGVYYKKFYKFFKKPLLFPGFIFLMTSELIAGGIGFIKSKYIFSRNKTNNLKENLVNLKENDLPFLSIIIPTYQADRYLDICLKAIYNQKYPKDKFEVFIIDGGSTDKTLEIASKYPVKILENSKRIAEYAKYIGIMKSKGDYFILLDSDNEIVEDDWLINMVNPILENDNIFGVESRLAADEKMSSMNRCFARMRIADPMAKFLGSRYIYKVEKNGYKILVLKDNHTIITGANGFLWKKSIILSFIENTDKFEETNIEIPAKLT